MTEGLAVRAAGVVTGVCAWGHSLDPQGPKETWGVNVNQAQQIR